MAPKLDFDVAVWPYLNASSEQSMLKLFAEPERAFEIHLDLADWICLIIWLLNPIKHVSFDIRNNFYQFLVNKIPCSTLLIFIDFSFEADLLTVCDWCSARNLDFLFFLIQSELRSFQLLAILEVAEQSKIQVLGFEVASTVRLVIGNEEFAKQHALSIFVLSFTFLLQDSLDINRLPNVW